MLAGGNGTALLSRKVLSLPFYAVNQIRCKGQYPHVPAPLRAKKIIGVRIFQNPGCTVQAIAFY